jgi:HEAT repeat protein
MFTGTLDLPMKNSTCLCRTIWLDARPALVVCAVLSLCLLLCGCPRKKAVPAGAAANTADVASATATPTGMLVKSEIEKNEALNELLDLPASEREEIQRMMGAMNASNQALQTTGATEDPGQDEILDARFEPTQDAKDLVTAATRAFLADLPEADKLASLQKLAGLDHPIVLEVVEMALSDKSAAVREAALDLIMNINDPAVVPTVAKALDDEDADLREYALDALMDVDDPKINEALTKALDDDNVDVRDNALNIMLYIGSPNVVDSLGKAIIDEDADIREKAIIAIEDIQDPRVIDVLLEKGLLSEDDNVREDAMDSLQFITDQEFENYEQAHAWWQRNRATFSFDE